MGPHAGIQGWLMVVKTRKLAVFHQNPRQIFEISQAIRFEIRD